MTIRNKIETQLVNQGLFPNEAKVVMEELEKTSKPMNGRWDDDETAYPPQLFYVVFMAAKQKSVEWIDANCPDHFARHILV